MMLRFTLFLPLFLSLTACAQAPKRPAPASHSYSQTQLEKMSDDDLCRDIALYPTTDRIRAEKTRRKLDCTDSTLAVIKSGKAGYLAQGQVSHSGPSFVQGLAQGIVTMNAAMARQQAIQQATCNSLSIPPMASIGCKNVCINGSWAQVC